MTKKELIWRHILDTASPKKLPTFTQKELARRFRFSLSTVHHALDIPRKIGAVEVTGRFFRLRDPEKLLYLWATQRNLKRDILYATHVDASVQKIEGAMVPGAIFAAFSAYRLRYKDAPADYDVVYVYAPDVDAIRARFPKTRGYENLVVLKPDALGAPEPHLTSDAQTFVDIWNTPHWYAKEFLEALKEKMKL
ncbi:hypothetical protein HYW17_04200 [Candidatus Uhrbacteria bacterium]|nr:hypothetical protein [Candidatus Uhrbacteria bacterium]